MQLPELLGQLEPPDWLVDCVSDQDADIAATEIISVFGELVEVSLCEIVGSVLHALFKHPQSE